jgi:hypothetical protein
MDHLSAKLQVPLYVESQRWDFGEWVMRQIENREESPS